MQRITLTTETVEEFNFIRTFRKRTVHFSLCIANRCGIVTAHGLLQTIIAVRIVRRRLPKFAVRMGEVGGHSFIQRIMSAGQPTKKLLIGCGGIVKARILERCRDLRMVLVRALCRLDPHVARFFMACHEIQFLDTNIRKRAIILITNPRGKLRRRRTEIYCNKNTRTVLEFICIRFCTRILLHCRMSACDSFAEFFGRVCGIRKCRHPRKLQIVLPKCRFSTRTHLAEDISIRVKAFVRLRIQRIEYALLLCPVLGIDVDAEYLITPP